MVMLNAQTAQSEDDFSGKSRPLPGRYHVAVNHAEEKASKVKGTPGLDIEFQVIADGITPDGKDKTAGQIGKTIPLFLSYIGGDDAKTKTCIDRVCRLALCVGILKPGEAKEPDWNEAIGRELVIEIEGQQYDDEKSGTVKTGSQVAFLGFWSLGNKAVANVPKDTGSPGMIALTKAGGPPSGNGNAAAKPAGPNGGSVQQTATQQAVAPAKNKWADL